MCHQVHSFFFFEFLVVLSLSLSLSLSLYNCLSIRRDLTACPFVPPSVHPLCVCVCVWFEIFACDFISIYFLLVYSRFRNDFPRVALRYGKMAEHTGGGRVVRWCWVNFQCRGVLLVWIRVGRGLLRLQWVRVGVVWTFFFRLSLPLSGRWPDLD